MYGLKYEDDLQYYVIERKADKPYPYVSIVPECPYSRLYAESPGPVRVKGNIKLSFGKPFTKSPAIGDYLGGYHCVISEKIKGVLDDMRIKTIQLIPADVSGPAGENYPDFFLFAYFRNIGGGRYAKIRFQRSRS